MSLVLAYALADNNGKSALCYSECGCDMWLRLQSAAYKNPQMYCYRTSLSITGTFHHTVYSCRFKLVWFSYVGNKKRTSAECPSCSFYTLIVNGDCLKMIKCSLNICLLYWYTNISRCFVCTSLQGLLSVTWESCLNRSWHLSYMMTGSKLQCKSVHAACLFLYGWC